MAVNSLASWIASSNSGSRTPWWRSESAPPSELPSWLHTVYAIANHPGFDGLSSLLVLANAVVMGLAVTWSAEHYWERGLPVAYDVLDYAFTAWFLAEFLLRLGSRGCSLLGSREDWGWNLLDVMITAADVGRTVVQVAAHGSEYLGMINASRLLRVLRVIRALRIVRLLRSFRELRMMVYSVMSSLQSLFWAIMLLFVILFVVGVYITQSVTSFRISSDPDDDLTLALEKYFGTLFGTMYYLLQSVTGGINWGEVTSPLLEIGWFYALFMSLFTCFTLFALLNIITGIFVEGAIQRAQNDKEAKIQDELEEETSKIQKLEEAFAEFDAEGTGFIELSAFETILSDPRVKAYFRSMGLHVSQAYHLFRLLDLDCSGTVNTSEFVMGCMRLQGGAKNVDVATLMYENKRMMLKWVTFMDFAEEQFNLLNDSVAMLRPDSAVPQSVEKKSTWREKLAKANLQNGSLNIYDQQEHNLLRSGTAGRACDEVP